MKKSRLEMLKEEVELARQGKITYEPDPPYVIIKNMKAFEKRSAAFRRMNGLPPKKHMLEPVSESKFARSTGARKASAVKKVATKTVELPSAAYSQLSRRAKREKMGVAQYIVKLLAK
jgi:hypothetical protein